MRGLKNTCLSKFNKHHQIVGLTWANMTERRWVLWMMGMLLSFMLACFPAHAASTASNSTPTPIDGSFRVSPSGSATYEIELVTAPGTQGIEPGIALTYNSQSGNGLAGVGWTLSGLSTITRCGATYVRDGFAGGVDYSADDRFCLDGTRLMNISGYQATYYTDGAVYHTEIESWKKITATGGACGMGPCGFTAQSKEGILFEYGSTADSRFMAVDAPGGQLFGDGDKLAGSVRAWALKKITDRNGNAMVFSYINAPTDESGTPIAGAANVGGNYISRIDYTSNDTAEPALPSQRSIQFFYGTRSDVSTSYQGGARTTMAARLSSIASCIATGSITDVSCQSDGASPVMSYNLTYCDQDAACLAATSTTTQRSILSSIEQCGTAAGTCLSPTNLNWQTGSNTIQATFDNNYGNGQLNTTETVCPSLQGVTWADFNGDGLLDWICSDYTNSGTVKVLVSTLSDTMGQQLLPPTGAASDGTLSGVTAKCTSGTVVWTDFTASGRVDWLCYDAKGNFYVRESTGTTLQAVSGASSSGQLMNNGVAINALCPQQENFSWVDVNGDSHIDWVCTDDSDNDVYILLSNGSTLLTDTGQAPASLADITPITLNPDCTSGSQYFWVDFNGDTLADWTCTDLSRSSLDVFLTVQDASGSISLVSANPRSDQGYVSGSLSCPSGTDDALIEWADLNGDGLLDWTCTSTQSSSVNILLSTATSLVNPDPSASSSRPYQQNLNCGENASISWLDFNGDSRADWVCYANGIVYPWLSNGTSFWNPVGNSGLQTGTNCASENGTVFWGDFNGDLMLDWICNDVPTSGGAGQVNVMIKAPGYPDMVSTLTDGQGGMIALTYSPLTDTGVYGAGQDLSYPNGDILGFPNLYVHERAPFHVVSGYSMSNAANVNGASGADYNYAYSVFYTNGVIGLEGLGWQGFETMTIFDQPTGNNLDVVFAQAYPFTGKTVGVTACTATSASQRCENASSDTQAGDENASGQTRLFASTTNYYCADGSCNNNQTFMPEGVDGRIYQVLSTGNSVSHESFGFRVEKNYSYDQYGNVILEADLGDTANDSHPVYTCTQYSNDVDAWLIGFPLNVKNASSSACPASASAWASYSYSAENGDLSWQQTTYDSRQNTISVINWDDQNGDWLGHVVTSRSDIGNVEAVAITNDAGANPTAVDNTVYTLSYDTVFQSFITTLTTPLANADDASSSLQTAFAYDARYGVPVGRKDTNGNVSLTCLDSFGQTVAVQGPVGGGATSGTDTNCLAGNGFYANLSGDFTAAAVTTLGTTEFGAETDASGNPAIYQISTTRTAWGQAFNDAATTWKKTYLDGIARLYKVVTQADATNSVIDLVYQSRKRIKQVSVPYAEGGSAENWVSVKYDAYGRKQQLTLPYDGGDTDVAAASTPCSTDAIATTTTTCWQYSAPNTTTEITAANTNEALSVSRTFSVFKGSPQIVKLLTQDGSALTQFGRDNLGRITSATDPLGAAITRTLDSLGRTKNVTDNTAGTRSNAYNMLGQLVDAVNAEGTQALYSYDGLNRVKSETLYRESAPQTAAKTTTYVYDNAPAQASASAMNLKGKLSGVQVVDGDNPAGSSSAVFGYDAYGNQNFQGQSVNGQNYSFTQTYGPLGNMLTAVYPGDEHVTVTYAYSTNGVLSGITTTLQDGSDAGYSALYQNFTLSGQPETVTYGNGVAENYVYGILGQVKNHMVVGVQAQQPALRSQGIVRDHQGNVTQLVDCTAAANAGNPACGNGQTAAASSTDASQSFGYTYNRLTSANGLYGALAYGYHTNGNIIQMGDVTYTYETSADNVESYRISTGSNGFSASYNDIGAMTSKTTSDGTVWSYVYDASNRLYQVKKNDLLVQQYTYNFSGARLTKTTYAADGATEVATTTYLGRGFEVRSQNGTTVQERAYLLDGMGRFAALDLANDQQGGFYLHRDPLKTSTQLVTAGEDGTILSEMHYKPYGATVSSGPDTADFYETKYEGHELDAETGLYYFGARYYDPEIGRFITADTQLGASADTQDAFNRYALDLNDPVLYFDPTGHRFSCGPKMTNFLNYGGGIVGLVAGADLGGEGGSIIGANFDTSWIFTASGVIGGGFLGATTGGPGSVALLCKTDSADNLIQENRDLIQQNEGLIDQYAGLLDHHNDLGTDYNLLQNNLQETEDLLQQTQAELEGKQGELEETQEGLLKYYGKYKKSQSTLNQHLANCQPNSFAAGTRILLADGTFKNITDIGVGDSVRAYDEGHDTVGNYSVTELFSRTAPGIFILTTEAGTRLEVTGEHPFRVQGSGWVKAQDLTPGQVLVTEGGSTEVVAHLEAVDTPTKVFNFSVDQAESYFVSDSKILVHNQTCPVSGTEDALELEGTAETGVTAEVAEDAVITTDVAVDAVAGGAEVAGDMAVAGAAEVSADIGLEIFADSLFLLLLL